jgi:hypothetical protein
MGDAKDNGLNKLVTTPYKINCWLLASLRKFKLTLLGRFLFSKFSNLNTQLTLYNNVMWHIRLTIKI